MRDHVVRILMRRRMFGSLILAAAIAFICSCKFSLAWIPCRQQPSHGVRRMQQSKVFLESTQTKDCDNENSSRKAPAWMRCVNGVTPPRVCALNEAVSKLAGVTLEEANDLVEIGAVWARLDALTEDEILDQYYRDEDDSGQIGGDGRIRYADLPSGWGGSRVAAEEEPDDLDNYIEKMESMRYKRILTPSSLPPGTDLRIYPKPRRFPSCYLLADQARLLYEDTTFLIVDKPPMLPTQPDASNYKECCPGCVNDLMGPFTQIDGTPVTRPLICHRVDSCVGGCVVLSKDARGQKVFSSLQASTYIGCGHHFLLEARLRVLRANLLAIPLRHQGERPECVLEVTQCEPITIHKHDGHTYDPGKTTHYQSTVRLVTGRKHQVRAQLASLGCPIVRDTLYQPIAGYTLDKLGDQEDDNEDSMDDAVAKCRIPKEPIGLQAHAILFGGVRARSRTPWWGDGTKHHM